MPSTSDLSAWEGRCVIAQGYAQAEKIGLSLDMGGSSIGVFLDGGHDWPVPLGARVEVRGWVSERADLPVFVPDPNGPIVQGMPVPEGTDLEHARKRWVIERAEASPLHTLEQVEAELDALLGQSVELSGVMWSRNGVWWFRHDGVDVHFETDSELGFDDHGQALMLSGTLSRRPMPRIDQIAIRAQPELAEAFVLKVEGRTPHPVWELRACPEHLE